MASSVLGEKFLGDVLDAVGLLLTTRVVLADAGSVLLPHVHRFVDQETCDLDGGA